MLSTAIYCRVSTEEQAKEGFSIHAQKDKLSKYAEINDWEVVDFYIDDGISGKSLDERPEVVRLIEDVKSGRIKNVLVYKLDRLTRSVKDLIYLIELFDKYNCTFNSQTEKIDTSNAVGRMFVKIIGIFAEFERENLAERVALGYEQKTREGNYTNTNGVFGYDYIIGGGLVVNEFEKKYVEKIYLWYKEGESMLSIANKLQREEVPTKRGGKWKPSTIKSILTNPLYIGNVRYGVHKKNGFEVDGKNIEKIISKDLFYRVQRLINKKHQLGIRGKGSSDTYYFRVLRCGKCGSRFKARQQRQQGKKYVSYYCSSCGHSNISHQRIEKSFLEYLSGIESICFHDFCFRLKDAFLYLTNDEKKSFVDKFIESVEVEKIEKNIIIKDVKF